MILYDVFLVMQWTNGGETELLVQVAAYNAAQAEDHAMSYAMRRHGQVVQPQIRVESSTCTTPRSPFVIKANYV